ncbi:uncharacterized protein [Nicotiana tomentosiformis]|uniref:uncharacterized protein n=1 Tax=Nicotiana tomentosiformis TaxID=4098 RepID=UPI00388C8352
MEAVEETIDEVPERVETDLARASEVEKECVTGTSRSEDNVPKEVPGVIDISGSPSFTDSMINEAQALKGKLGEWAQGAIDPFNNFLDGLDSIASEDATGLGDLPVPNKASVLHHKAFFRIQEEHEAEVRELTEKGDTYRLLSEKLRVNLEAAQSEHIEMDEQVRQRLKQIGQLKTQIDAIQAEAEEFKKNMDILALKKEIIQAQLESAETQLQAAKEKASVQVKKIEELQSQLDLAISDKANLANELEVVRSEMAMANTKADAKVAQFKVDVEAIRAHAKSMVDHARWQARKEALEGVHDQGFDILAEIENTKAEEARPQKLAFPEEDSESLSESEDGEDPKDGDAASDEDQVT